MEKVIYEDRAPYQTPGWLRIIENGTVAISGHEHENGSKKYLNDTTRMEMKNG